MHLFISSIVLLSPLCAFGLERKSPSRIAVTPHVLTLTTVPLPHPFPASSNHLRKRLNLAHAIPSINDTDFQQNEDDNTVAEIQQDLLTLSGRVYMTNITLAGQPYTVVIDTGSSDTWIARSTFQCQARNTRMLLPQSACGFGDLYSPDLSQTYVKIPTHDFSVRYTDGEFLSGEMGTEQLEIGGLATRQTIGVVQRGYWVGDDISSGLMGLAYPTLASNVKDLNYTTVVFSLLEDGTVPAVFSLALSRPTRENPRAGGLLAIGGIPNIQHGNDFVSVPIRPIISTTYAFYSVAIDGFNITPPPTTNLPRHILRQTNLSFANQAMEMIIDSGTTLMYVPDAVADYIANLLIPPARYNAVSNLYVVDCNAIAPRVGVTIAGKTFFVNESDLLNRGAFGEGTPVAGSRGRREGCVLAVQKQGQGSLVLGDAFLKNVLAVFDVGQNEMRFSDREIY